MSRTFEVVFYDENTLPLAGLSPSFASPGFYKTLAGVNTAPPAIVDLGAGVYGFTLSAADESTGITFLMDGGVTPLERFWFDSIQPTAAAQAGTTVSPTPVNLFGVTFTNLYARHFPQWSAATPESVPSSATVAEMIDEAAATLEAKLAQESIVATGLLVTNTAAYLWCRETLRLMAAIEVVKVATQQVPPLSENWQKQLDARWEELDEKGYLALGGGVSAPTEQPDGPTHFIDTLGLDTSVNDANASRVDMPFHKDDCL